MMQFRQRLALAASLFICWTHQYDSVIPGALAFAPAKSYQWRPRSSSTMTYTKQRPALFSGKSPFSFRTLQTHWGDKDKAKSPLLAAPLSEDKDETNSKTVELVALGAWLATIAAFILVNNFVGPWPEAMTHVPEPVYKLLHMVSGMLFGGGVIVTAAMEWLVVKDNNNTVLQFWFNKVPLLDGLIVLPALTVAMISGTGLSIQHYGTLGNAPAFVQAEFYALLAFCAWWAFTDLTTQGKALIAVNELQTNDEKGKANEYASSDTGSAEPNEIPNVLGLRTGSNVVSSLFVIILYAIMVMKPGTLFPFP
jgi:hypothetical protein